MMKKRTNFTALFVCSLFLFGCEDATVRYEYEDVQNNDSCGNAVCDSNETCDSCEKDCGSCNENSWCGDGTCDSDESCKSCEKDCGKCAETNSCGDGKCNGNESCKSCEKDCGKCAETASCGDGECNGDETCESCEKDCGKCSETASCGDQKCNGDETCESCEKDCGKCSEAASCGDGKCNGDETCESCEIDCGKCAEANSCGDQKCDGDETCESCEKDCGKCAETASCGDGKCNGDETCESCEKDCGKCAETAFCGDGACNGDETCKSCEKDCGKCAETNFCGDGACNGDETCKSCEKDCGKCAICGNNNCENEESCESCPIDCGRCEYCGDNICNNGETFSTCPKDCNNFCGDKICQDSETYEKCPKDCLSKHPCANGCPNKAVFLYTGTPYNDYTADEIDAFGLTHFVLCPAVGYDTWGYGDANNRYPQLVQVMVKTIDMIIGSTNGENKKVWIGTPMMECGFDIKEAGGDNGRDSCGWARDPAKTYPKYAAKDFFALHYKMYTQYIDDLRAALGPEKWNKHVVGIYVHSESIHGQDIKNDVNINDPLKNYHIKLFYDLSQYIHKPYTSGGKTWNAVKFLWSPYYPTEWFVKDSVLAMGAVTNVLDVFDDVIIQVGYYENGSKYDYMNHIKYGTYNNALMDIQKTAPTSIAGGSKKSKTKIGVQMEFSNEIHQNNEKKARYYETEKCFNNETYKINGYNKENYLFSYYMDAKDPNVLSKSQEIVRKFFGVIPFIKENKQ